VSGGYDGASEGLIITGIMAGVYLFIPALALWAILAIAGKGLEGERGETIRLFERMARWLLISVMLITFLSIFGCMLIPGKP